MEIHLPFYNWWQIFTYPLQIIIQIFGMGVWWVGVGVGGGGWGVGVGGGGVWVWVGGGGGGWAASGVSNRKCERYL